jgi:L,D-transpeptidase YcfS
MRVSSGCIRLRDDDIKALYNAITPGTKVNIINTPIKVPWSRRRRLVEVHQPLSKHIDDDPQTLPIVLNAACKVSNRRSRPNRGDGARDDAAFGHAD